VLSNTGSGNPIAMNHTQDVYIISCLKHVTNISKLNTLYLVKICLYEGANIVQSH